MVRRMSLSDLYILIILVCIHAIKLMNRYVKFKIYLFDVPDEGNPVGISVAYCLIAIAVWVFEEYRFMFKRLRFLLWLISLIDWVINALEIYIMLVKSSPICRVTVSVVCICHSLVNESFVTWSAGGIIRHQSACDMGSTHWNQLMQKIQWFRAFRC